MWISNFAENLKPHEEAVHVGKTIQCSMLKKCEYSAIKRANLVIRQNLPWTDCEYQGTRKSNLVSHQSSVIWTQNSNVLSMNISLVSKWSFQSSAICTYWSNTPMFRLRLSCDSEKSPCWTSFYMCQKLHRPECEHQLSYKSVLIKQQQCVKSGKKGPTNSMLRVCSSA